MFYNNIILTDYIKLIFSVIVTECVAFFFRESTPKSNVRFNLPTVYCFDHDFFGLK